MKTMCPSGFHHNGFVATHALGHMSTSCLRTTVQHVTKRRSCQKAIVVISIYVAYNAGFLNILRGF